MTIKDYKPGYKTRFDGSEPADVAGIFAVNWEKDMVVEFFFKLVIYIEKIFKIQLMFFSGVYILQSK